VVGIGHDGVKVRERIDREAPLFHPLKTAGVAGLLLAASLAHATAQDHPWLDPKLLDAAKAEGGEMTIYSDTNEGEAPIRR
jgi:hypothetical protein